MASFGPTWVQYLDVGAMLGERRVRVRVMPGRAEIGTAKVEWGVATHIGAGHERNQDAYCTQPPVFVVADGVGGHTDGELASREVVQALQALSGQVSVDMGMLT